MAVFLLFYQATLTSTRNNKDDKSIKKITFLSFYHFLYFKGNCLKIQKSAKKEKKNYLNGPL